MRGTIIGRVYRCIVYYYLLLVLGQTSFIDFKINNKQCYLNA